MPPEPSAMDAILSPENFPPCDELAAAARAELADLRDALVEARGKLRWIAFEPEVCNLDMAITIARDALTNLDAALANARGGE